MTYEQVIAKLREYSAQIVTKPDNEFSRMADSLETYLIDQQDLAKALAERHDLAVMIRRLLVAIDHGHEREAMKLLYRQAFDLLTRQNLHGQPLHGSDHA
jgi:hypothetical protein